MGENTPDFQSLLVQLEGRLAPELLLFLCDLARHCDEKFALECLIDQMRRQGVPLSAGIAGDMLQVCGVLGIDQGRRGAVPGLIDFNPARPSRDAQRAAACSLGDLIAADDPAAFGVAKGAGELLIVRALREKFGISFDEAMLRLKAANTGQSS